MAIVPYSLVEARVDWLTATKCGNPRDDGLLNLGRELLVYSGNSGKEVKPWRWRGYDGEHRGEVTVGRRDDSDILQLSGALAEEWFDAAVRESTRISRVDLCVTVRYPSGERNYASEAYASGLANVKRDPTGAGWSYIVNSDGGSTAYCGSRTSDLFGRVYDKWRERFDEHYRDCWRWEVEIKGDVADRTVAKLASSSDRGGTCLSLVSGYYKRRGASSGWMDGFQGLPIETLRPVTTDDSRLRWLATQVRPVVQRLTALGYGKEVNAALGFTETLEERWRRRARGVENHKNELESEE